MEEHREPADLENAAPPVEEGYIPRPAWQVWAARIGLILFVGFVIYQLLSIAGGGR